MIMKKANLQGQTATEIPTIREITTKFIETELKKRKDRSDGQNDYLKSFLFAASAIADNFEHRTFDFQDLALYANHLDVPADELKRYFGLWVRHLKKGGRVQEISGCYNDSVFAFV